MSQDITKQLTTRWRNLQEEERYAMTEVLCSAYKDATGGYPSDRLREALFEAIRYNT